jgi:hypothetical protein
MKAKSDRMLVESGASRFGGIESCQVTVSGVPFGKIAPLENHTCQCNNPRDIDRPSIDIVKHQSIQNIQQ